MLSFIYQMCRQFEQKLGYPPNVLFINSDHLENLHRSYQEGIDDETIRQTLGLQILLRQDSLHPSVHWLASAERCVG
jgi:hypothetical protein